MIFFAIALNEGEKNYFTYTAKGGCDFENGLVKVTDRENVIFVLSQFELYSKKKVSY